MMSEPLSEAELQAIREWFTNHTSAKTVAAAGKLLAEVDRLKKIVRILEENSGYSAADIVLDD
jgi:hypothetical protein